MITTPYNFVPLSDKVVCPPWSSQVSHDIPFEGSESGMLKLTIEAKSPIYVRNGVNKNAIKSTRNDFNHFDNQYFIPSSSIKGMIRSVLEIMSFGRMGNKVNNHRYSVRDFQNSDIYPKETFSKDILCGWLQKIEGEYFLTNCGKPARISHKVIDEKFNIEMSVFFRTQENLRDTSTKAAKFKYDTFKTIIRKGKFSINDDKTGRLIAKFDDTGEDGVIVFTGQPGVRNEPTGQKSSGKHLEFVFLNTSNEPIKVPNTVIQTFFFAYFDHDKTNQKADWKWRKPQLEKGEKIPVFFRKNTDETIKDMGLSFLYKITYENSIKEAINNYQKIGNDKLDLSETIFGYVEDTEALKGRVFVGHAFATKATPLTIKTEVLAGPKASYYPTYVEQNINIDGKVSKYATFKDSVTINGWKRYPVRSNSSVIHHQGTANMITEFIPLDTGATFKVNVGYHNLRKEELGALISAITFHNTNYLFHSIGMAKPLGYGKIAVSLQGIEEAKKIEYLKAFELFMDNSLNHSSPLWFQLPQIKELFSMAQGAKDSDVDERLKYMELTSFVDKKGRQRNDPKYALQKFSVINNATINVKSLITKDELVINKQKYLLENDFYTKIHDTTTLRNQFENTVKDELYKKLEAKKAEVISWIRNKQKERKELEIIEKELKEREERDVKKLQLQKQNQEIGIDFSSIDFSKNIKSIEEAVSKIVLIYASRIHLTNERGLKSLAISYLISESDIEKVKQVIITIYSKLPQNERKDDKMKYRLLTWSKWIGSEQIQILIKK